MHLIEVKTERMKSGGESKRDFGWDGCLVGVITLIIIVKKVKLIELVFVTSFMKMNKKLLDASSSKLYTNKRQRICIPI